MDDTRKPEHYRWHPEGIECMDVVKHMPFLRGNAVKYLWRAGRKGDGKNPAKPCHAVRDLRKAIRCIEEEIEMILQADNPELTIDQIMGLARRDLT